MAVETDNVKVYTVNGATASSSSSLPDWLTRKRAAKKGKRAVREHIEGTIELIQGFEFPEASNRIKTTRDGQFAIATGTYKPQMRVWDLAQLTLKFERHSDAENVDFVMLSDDWTKSIHLQNDRTIEVHTQGGFHYRTRIPRFGRSLAYHFPSCDALFSAVGNEIYRLNLDQGRFMTPLVLQDDQEILGVNTIDVNPAHQLLAFGLEGTGSAQFWDPRSRSSVGVLRLPRSRLLPPGAGGDTALSVTAISSRADGLSYALGTSTGHTLLYDIRAAQPFALKDQGYGLPVKSVAWIEGGSRMAGDGMVLSADRKVIKIWDRNSPSTNFAAITPAADLNHVHHVPASGLLMTANEGIQMATYYIPQLGPAPRWASFLENITEEMEDQTTRSVYEDFKFVERSELKTLGLDHLVGTPTLKPYMHGYFLSLKLYDAARIIANPFAYSEYREKVVRERMEKMAETRIRAKKDGAAGVKVNKALAEKILRDEERKKKRVERRKKRAAAREGEAVADGEGEAGDAEMEVDDTAEGAVRPSLLTDPRFAKVFEDPAFAVDETTREYALLNPSAAAHRRTGGDARRKTAVEEEEEESDKVSSDGLGEASDGDSDGEGSGSDSSDAGALNKFDPRARPGQKNARVQEAYSRTREQNRLANQGNFVPMRPASTGANGTRLADRNATFGQRRGTTAGGSKSHSSATNGAGAMEVSWVPSASSGGGGMDVDAEVERSEKKGKSKARKGVEVFGAGMEKGYSGEDLQVSEQDRKGRTQRRKGVRSGSKNVFRRMDA
ncbi:NUC153 and WD40 repeat-containing nucleolar rRNA processing-related protein [Mycena alexandri]|uniref:NUC153 and WD40 repeat-containing nucleolar rRNA processing-related protein n=1 Tax=Mycena alexandri TaxID=1745969 RepID=A0AAD6T8K9_9AGAR|nr:NUC153 and WD40 repeat-containing nucleolar rRNA processing-related protein [Mycena alexandri]KAJ7039768.1 NUC153 and WD40 repeat-containing nucleolar rRNA processing-related protein [Mycena alexandri]